MGLGQAGLASGSVIGSMAAGSQVKKVNRRSLPAQLHWMRDLIAKRLVSDAVQGLANKHEVCV